MYRKLIIAIVLIVNVGIIATVAITNHNSKVAEAVSRFGSSGNEVKQIQTKLKNWGYYKGDIDGIYGSKTVSAVKYFQRKNGLTVDGIAGSKTLAAMGIRSSSNNSSAGTSQANLNLLAHLIHGEARGEPYNRNGSSSSGCIK